MSAYPSVFPHNCARPRRFFESLILAARRADGRFPPRVSLETPFRAIASSIFPARLPLRPARQAGGRPIASAIFVTMAVFLVVSFGASPVWAQARTPLKGTVYVTSWFGGTVTIVDLAGGGSAERTIPVRIHTHNVALRPDQKQVWVTNNDAGTVSIDGRWLLITNAGANSISIIDTETDEVIKTSPVPKAPEGIAVKR